MPQPYPRLTTLPVHPHHFHPIPQVDAVDEEDVEAFLAERWEQLRLNVAEVDTLVRREDDDSWTIVNWQLSRHSGRWLTDSLTITE